jgi:hypothetical protein
VRHSGHALGSFGLENRLLRGQAAHGEDDDPDTFGMPALDRLMVGTQQLRQSPPGKEVPSRGRVNQSPAPHDAAQEVAVLGNQAQVAQRLSMRLIRLADGMDGRSSAADQP